MATLKQAQARYKQSFKTEAPADMTIDQIEAALAEKKQAKADADAEAKAEAKAVADAEAKAKAPKFKVNKKAFPKIHIPGMGEFTADDLEANAEACEYLFEIGSPVVTKL